MFSSFFQQLALAQSPSFSSHFFKYPVGEVRVLRGTITARLINDCACLKEYSWVRIRNLERV